MALIIGHGRKSGNLWDEQGAIFDCQCPVSIDLRFINKKVAGFALHTDTDAYGCSVPRLTRFACADCKGPGH